MPCRLPPMEGGQRCRMHGGTSPGRPLLHGRYSLTHRAALADKMQAFLADPHPGDLAAELALMRALLQDYLDRFAGDTALPPDDIARIFGMVDDISRLVERIARIFNQTALTQVEVQLLQVRIADLVIRYVESSKQLAFLDELAAAFGSDRSDPRPRLTAEPADGL